MKKWSTYIKDLKSFAGHSFVTAGILSFSCLGFGLFVFESFPSETEPPFVTSGTGLVSLV